MLLCITLALVFLPYFADGQSIARQKWNRNLLTPDSSDVVEAVALGGDTEADQEFAIIAGTVKAPRGSNVSLQAIVSDSHATSANAQEPYNASTRYTDAFIVRVSAENGTIEWAHRLGSNSGVPVASKSRYFDVALNEGQARVYAVGHQKNIETKSYDAVLTILDSDTGSVISTTRYNNSSPGNAELQSVSFSEKAIFMCGSDTSRAADESRGIVVIKAALDGTLLWARKLGENRVRDRCAGISTAQKRKSIVVAAVVHKDTLTTKKRGLQPTAQTAVYKLDDSTGATSWETLVPRSMQVEDVASAVVVDEHGAYVSSTKWLNPIIGKRIFLSKLSMSTGQQLWSKDVCCGELVASLPDKQQYEEKGSAEAARGAVIGNDGYIYVHGYYRHSRGNAPNTFASIVTRISIFGSHEGEEDVSPPIETFQYESSKPVMMTSTTDRLGYAVVARVGDLSSSDEEANNVRVVGVQVRSAGTQKSVRYLQSTGSYYTGIRVKLSPVLRSKIPLSQIRTAVAELIHVGIGQVDVSVDPRDDLIRVTVTAFHDNPKLSEQDDENAEILVERAISPTGRSRQSPLQEMLEVDAGTLEKSSAVQTVGSGVSSNLGGLSQLGYVENDDITRGDGAVSTTQMNENDPTNRRRSGASSGCVDARVLPKHCRKVHSSHIYTNVVCAAGFTSESHARKSELCMTGSHVVVFDGQEMTGLELCQAPGIVCREDFMHVNSCVAYTKGHLFVSPRLQVTHFSTPWRRLQISLHLLITGFRAVRNIVFVCMSLLIAKSLNSIMGCSKQLRI